MKIPRTELSFALGAFPGVIESQILGSVAGAILCSQKLGLPVLRSKIYHLSLYLDCSGAFQYPKDKLEINKSK